MPSPEHRNGIFICYRREDSEDFSARLEDALSPVFGKESVFRDHGKLRGGLKWRDEIDRNLEGAAVILILIGKYWLDTSGPGGKSRLFNEGDFVTYEISTAFRLGIPAIPILIGETLLPSPEHLPDPLRPLLDWQINKVRRDQHFHSDVKILIDDIRFVFQRAETARQAAAEEAERIALLEKETQAAKQRAEAAAKLASEKAQAESAAHKARIDNLLVIEEDDFDLCSLDGDAGDDDFLILDDTGETSQSIESIESLIPPTNPSIESAKPAASPEKLRKPQDKPGVITESLQQIIQASSAEPELSKDNPPQTVGGPQGRTLRAVHSQQSGSEASPEEDLAGYNLRRWSELFDEEPAKSAVPPPGLFVFLYVWWLNGLIAIFHKEGFIFQEKIAAEIGTDDLYDWKMAGVPYRIGFVVAIMAVILIGNPFEFGVSYDKPAMIGILSVAFPAFLSTFSICLATLDTGTAGKRLLWVFLLPAGVLLVLLSLPWLISFAQKMRFYNSDLCFQGLNARIMATYFLCLPLLQGIAHYFFLRPKQKRGGLTHRSR